MNDEFGYKPFPVTCIRDEMLEFLITKGKVYIVLEDTPWMVLIMTDQGTKEWIGRSRFDPNGMVTVHE